MAEDVIGVIREEVGPLGQSLREEVGGLRREMFSHFDEIPSRFDQLESESQAFGAGLSRLVYWPNDARSPGVGATSVILLRSTCC